MIDLLIAFVAGVALGGLLTVAIVSIACEAWKDIWK